mmetsp:Transcript_114954/g.187325  ORF Transcript_114954/g.187325 Transcript_114954/m.187325 type:complete len:138 (-) Transcript_114954:130-543(-)
MGGFQEFVNSAKSAGCRVAIVTFGRKDVVKKAVDYALGEGSGVEISSPQDVGIKEGSDDLGNKNALISRLAARHKIKPIQIVFVDDDPLHVRQAAAIGVNVFHAPSGATKDVLRRVAATIQDRSGYSPSPSYSFARG